MIKKIAFGSATLLLLTSPFFALADVTSDVQARIDALLSQIKSLQTQLLQLQQGGGTSPVACTMEAKICPDGSSVGRSGPHCEFAACPGATITPPHCPIFTRTLMRGISGSDVSDLQIFLKESGNFDGTATGFFGPLTEAAVQKWQSSNGIAASGNPSTTGWGLVGPASRAFFTRKCSTGGDSQNFSADPTSGNAPLTVTFTASDSIASTATYSVDFDDGTGSSDLVKGACIGISAIQGGQGGIRCSYTTTHTYASNGTYSAKLMKNTCPAGVQCFVGPLLAGTITISVGVKSLCPLYTFPVCTDNSTLVSGGLDQNGCQLPPRCVPPTGQGFSATPRSGVAPLSVTFFAQFEAGEYDVDFGDGTDQRLSIPVYVQAPCPTDRAVHCAEPGIPRAGVVHVYAASGTYVATLSRYIACLHGVPPCMIVQPAPIAYATIVVGTSTSPICPNYNIPLCSENYVLISQGQDSKGCYLPPKCVAPGSATPTISGLDAPTSLMVGQSGTWTVHATAPSGTQLSYSAVWGDEANSTLVASTIGSSVVATNGTLTHAYSSPGTFTPKFTVSNGSGSAQASASVVVSNSSSGFVVSPTSGSAPLVVQFGSTVGGTVLFGDGASSAMMPAPTCATCGPWSQTTHTYVTPGTYTAIQKSWCSSAEPACSSTSLANATIVVN